MFLYDNLIETLSLVISSNKPALHTLSFTLLVHIIVSSRTSGFLNDIFTVSRTSAAIFYFAVVYIA